ncbi:MAG: hypothetical protein PHO70_00810 [Candidatus Omnitrophica bacterium]|nr:hypothetical protein [Candidatus Omnitrophota bacterium]
MVVKKKTKKKVKITKRKTSKAKLAKKVVKKKPSVKPKLKKSKVVIKKKNSQGSLIGVITHYFPHVRAAVVKMKAQLAAGDSIKIKGHTTDFTQVASSLQIDRLPIQLAKKGDEIGLLVESRVRSGDLVYKV